METFTRDGLTFDVRDSGPLAGGDPGGDDVVVLLHGFPQDASAYDAVVPLLTGAGLRTLVPDQRGYSPRARPTARRAYALRELVDDVVALLDAAGTPRAHVVGHDWGGAVAWAFASRRSERTASLTAISTPHPAAMTHALLRSDQALRSGYMLGFQTPWLPERLLLADEGARLRGAMLDSGLSAAHAQRYTERIRRSGALTAALSWYRGIPFSRGFGAGMVHVPTTYLVGKQDRFFAPAAALATPRYVRGPFRGVALDAGHWIPETHPADVAAAVLAPPV